MAEAGGMVIVGAGHTGGRAAHTLREAGWNGAISLIGTEPHVPYERPPLSKEMLVGTKSPTESALFDRAFYREQGIDLRMDATVRRISRERKEVALDTGEPIAFGKLLFATGAEPRRLDIPGIDRDGVCYLRDLNDSAALAGRLGPGRHLTIVGGGFIGLEVAANAIGLGCQVTVVEAGPRLLMRAVPSMIEERVRSRHVAMGVDLRLERQVTAVLGDNDHVNGVRLDGGEEIATDVVLISIGVVPRVELAREAGLAVDDGIVVDSTLRTGDPDIYAAGDVCSFRHNLFAGHLRLESWKNAEEQGPLAARNMLGAGEEHSAVPWMWSDQYDMTIQIAGVPDQATFAVERAADPDSLIVFHLAEDGRVIGASGVGGVSFVGRNVRLGQMMIERRLYPDPVALADPSVNLKALVRERAA